MLMSRTVSVSIECPSHVVYDYIADRDHLSAWAVEDDARAGEASRPSMDGEASSAPELQLGVSVAGPGGSSHTLRAGTLPGCISVLPNCDGADVLLTLFRPSTASDSGFEEAVRFGEHNIRALKRLLEANAE